jgi:hypothetical protein
VPVPSGTGLRLYQARLAPHAEPFNTYGVSSGDQQRVPARAHGVLLPGGITRSLGERVRRENVHSSSPVLYPCSSAYTSGSIRPATPGSVCRRPRLPRTARPRPAHPSNGSGRPVSAGWVFLRHFSRPTDQGRTVMLGQRSRYPAWGVRLPCRIARAFPTHDGSSVPCIADRHRQRPSQSGTNQGKTSRPTEPNRGKRSCARTRPAS